MTPPLPITRDPLAWLVMVLVITPIAILQTPPLVDLSAHALRMYLVAYVSADQAPWEYFSFQPTFSPNFGFDAFFYLFALVAPFRVALTLASFVCFGILAAGIVALSRSLHGRVSPGAVFACVFVFSWPMQLGIMNFGVSVGLAFLCLAAYLRRPAPSIGNGVFLGALALLVWVAHVAGWGVLGLMVLGTEMARVIKAQARLREMGQAVLRGLPLAVPAVLTVIWITIFTGDTAAPQEVSAGAGYSIDWGQKLSYAISALRLQWPFFDLAVLGFAGLVAMWGCLGRDIPLALPALLAGVLLLVGFILLPPGIGTTYFLDRRMVMPLGMVVLVGLGPQAVSRFGRLIQGAMIGVSVLYMAVMTVAWLGMARHEAEQVTLLEPVPAGSRVLLLEVRACAPSPVDQWPVLRHPQAIMTLTEQGSFVNGTWDLPGSNGFGIPHARGTGWSDIEDAVIHASTCPQGHWLQRLAKFDPQSAAAALPRALYDYVWFVSDRPEDLPTELGEGYELIDQRTRGALYKITQ